jgi:hypothetical protein
VVNARVVPEAGGGGSVSRLIPNGQKGCCKFYL